MVSCVHICMCLCICTQCICIEMLRMDIVGINNFHLSSVIAMPYLLSPLPYIMKWLEFVLFSNVNIKALGWGSVPKCLSGLIRRSSLLSHLSSTMVSKMHLFIWLSLWGEVYLSKFSSGHVENSLTWLYQPLLHHACSAWVLSVCPYVCLSFLST